MNTGKRKVVKNIFSSSLQDLSQEAIEDLVRSSHVRIERIVSHWHSSPDAGWYDQEESRGLSHCRNIYGGYS